MLLINKLLEKIKRTDYFKNIFTLVSGNILGYGLNVLLLPIISRLYSPDVLGEYDLIISTGNMINGILCLGLITAIMLPKEEEKAIALCKIIRFVLVTITTFLFLVLVILSPKLRMFDVNCNYITACFLLYLNLVFLNLQSVYYSYTNRKKKYRVLFWNPIIGACIKGGLTVLFGFWGWGVIGYAMGTILSYLGNIIHMACNVNPFKGKQSIRYMIQVYKENKEFTTYQMPANLVSNFADQIPLQYLGRYFGTAMLGGYSMAVKLLSIPVSLLATPINRVFYRTASERYNEGKDIGEFTFQLLKTNVRIACIPICILMIFGELLLPLFLGEEWKEAGKYIAIMGMYVLMQFCSVCTSGDLVILKKQKINLAVAFANIFWEIICFLSVSIWNLNIVEAVFLYSFLKTMYYTFTTSLFLHYTEFKVTKYLKFIFKYMFLCLIVTYAVRFLIYRN